MSSYLKRDEVKFVGSSCVYVLSCLFHCLTSYSELFYFKNCSSVFIFFSPEVIVLPYEQENRFFLHLDKQKEKLKCK